MPLGFCGSGQNGGLESWNIFMDWEIGPSEMLKIVMLDSGRRRTGCIQQDHSAGKIAIGMAMVHRILGHDEVGRAGIQPHALKLFVRPVIGRLGHDQELN